MVDDNWVRGQQQGCEALGNLRELQSGTVKNLKQDFEKGGSSLCMLCEETVTKLDPSILERPQEAESKSDY